MVVYTATVEASRPWNHCAFIHRVVQMQFPSTAHLTEGKGNATNKIKHFRDVRYYLKRTLMYMAIIG